MGITVSAQTKLGVAFREQNDIIFKEALRNEANPFIFDQESGLSIFELACRTPGCSKFIKLCLDVVKDFDINKLNPNAGKTPFHFAIESIDPDNLSAILAAKPNINSTTNGLTAFHQLIKFINVKVYNMRNIFICIQLLVDHNIDVNVPDSCNIPPILTLIKVRVSGVEPIIEYLLKKCQIDLDSYNGGEVRKILQLEFPIIKLPPPRRKIITFYTLKQMLDIPREYEFITDLDFLMKSNPMSGILLEEDADNGTLFYMACKKGLFEIVKHLIEMYGVDVNYKPPKMKYCSISIACLQGHADIIKYLMQQDGIVLQKIENFKDDNENNCIINEVIEEPLLCLVIEQMKIDPTRFTECLEILLNDQRINFYKIEMAIKYKALYYAIRCNRVSLIMKLLKCGAYIGATSEHGDYAISEINPNILETYFDSCITPNEFKPCEKNYEINLDYKCLVPSPGDAEMPPLEFIAQSPELRKLIKHPLIATFIWLKWTRLAPVYYMNFILFTIFDIILITFVVFRDRFDIFLASFFYNIIVVGLVYITLREFSQMVVEYRSYFKSLQNYIELCLILFTGFLIFDTNYSTGVYYIRVIGAVTILLAATDLSMLFGSLPISPISVHMVMLKTVFLTFMKSFLFYSILIISFGLCFFILFGPVASENSDNDFNSFTNPTLSIIKTIIMFTGEFDTASLPFNNQLLSYLIFMFFVFVVSIVLLNLLNGLAVIDTQTVNAEVKLAELIYRVQLLVRYEKLIFVRWFKCILNLFNCRKRSYYTHVFHDCLSVPKLILLPNLKNSVLIESTRLMVKRTSQKFILGTIDDAPEKFYLPSPLNFRCCPFSTTRYKLERLIMNDIKNVLEAKAEMEKRELEMKKQADEYEQGMKNLEQIRERERIMEERYLRMETSLKRNEMLLKSLLQKFGER